MDVNNDNTENLFVNYVDPSTSHSLVILCMVKIVLCSKSLQFQLLGQAPVPGPPLQTISLPTGIALTPGTVLTLQNGQVSDYQIVNIFGF